MAGDHPYRHLPRQAFWRSGVAELHPLQLQSLWTAKFDLQAQDRVVTYGSCFAQHIGRALKARGYTWHNAELPPPQLSPDTARRFNYGVFSARTGNIYTTTLLLQWCRWALDGAPVPDIAWQASDGRWYDPFRPAIEPDGFASRNELLRSRSVAIEAFGRSIADADYFVFTLGLTESWRRADRSFEYAICPGTVAGTYDGSTDTFVNLDYPSVHAALEQALDLMRERNPRLRFILTVSPVPLTATNSGDHVLVATSGSKAVLRAVAGDLARRRADVDYFPSFEIISSPTMRGMFFGPNQRDVVPAGVDFVMSHFFAGRGDGDAASPPSPDEIARPTEAVADADTLVCEEELLDAFSGAAA